VARSYSCLVRSTSRYPAPGSDRMMKRSRTGCVPQATATTEPGQGLTIPGLVCWVHQQTARRGVLEKTLRASIGIRAPKQDGGGVSGFLQRPSTPRSLSRLAWCGEWCAGAMRKHLRLLVLADCQSLCNRSARILYRRDSARLVNRPGNAEGCVGVCG
jgi:hypothetical protein